MTEKEFKKCPFLKRYDMLKEEGEHITSRYFAGYEVHLYIFRKLYVEVWLSVALRQVIWIEPLRNKEAWREYLKNIDIRKDLGLDNL